MKYPITLFSVLVLTLLSSCGGNTAEEAAIKEELHQIDSISIEVGEIVTEIDDKSKALDEAISEMEKTLNQ
jgi:hypothetical protein